MRMKWAVLLGFLAGLAAAAEPKIDLTFVYKPVPVEKNGFPFLIQAKQVWKRPSDAPAHLSAKATSAKGRETERAAWNRLSNWSVGRLATVSADDLEFAKRFLKRNEYALKLVDRAIACDRIQAPEVKAPDDGVAFLSFFRSFARAKAVRARLTAEAGDLKSACDELMTVIAFGAKLKNSDSVLITYLVGGAVQSIGANAWAALIARPGVSSAQLKDYCKELAKYADDREALATVLRVERKMAFVMVKQVLEQEVMKLTGSKTLNVPGLYDAERTKAMIDAHYRSALKSAQARASSVAKDWKREHPVTILMSFNAMGETVYRMLMPMLVGVDRKAREDRLTLQVLRLYLAIHAYYQRGGELPENLDELVKRKYLDAVPDDPFGARKLSYSAERRVIWSLGRDGKAGDPTSPVALAKRTDGLFSFRAMREENPTFLIPFVGGTGR